MAYDFGLLDLGQRQGLVVLGEHDSLFLLLGFARRGDLLCGGFYAFVLIELSLDEGVLLVGDRGVGVRLYLGKSLFVEEIYEGL